MDGGHFAGQRGQCTGLRALVVAIIVGDCAVYWIISYFYGEPLKLIINNVSMIWKFEDSHRQI